ncbi:MAG TPA: DUF2845 domain-containing protein [Woeseiaceae bacterium]|nr:DUF2845 domain-containing protein [Woeseiaceae bacterium]
MTSAIRTLPLIISLLGGIVLPGGAAHALRCEGKLVLEGMLQIEVVEHCGEPTAVRERGFVVRAWTPMELMRRPDAEGVRFGPGNFYQHLLVTEFIYNFGPSRLMRKLRFEGGMLTDIETLGYGYHED